MKSNAPRFIAGSDLGHVAIGRNDDGMYRQLALAQHRKQRQPVHDRHVDVEQQQVDVRLVGEDRQGFRAVTGEAEGKLLRANLAAEALADQGPRNRSRHRRPGSWQGRSSHSPPQPDGAGNLKQLLFQGREIDGLGDEFGGSAFCGLPPPLVIAIRQ
jgi:hypothetical protein